MLNMDITAPRARAFIAKNFPGEEPIKVSRTRQGPTGQCYTNVRRLVLSDGGKAVWGWMLKEVPGRYLEAQHHSVWENPAGMLEDVTADTKDDAEQNAILFIRGDIPPTDAYEPAIPSIFKQLDTSPRTKRWIEGNLTRMQLIAKCQRVVRDIPHSLTPDGQMIAAPPFPPAFAALNARIEKITQELFMINREITNSIRKAQRKA